MGRKSVRIMLVDDHNLIREGISLLLEKDEDLKVVGECKDGEEAINMASFLNPVNL